ncbi:MAG: DUF4232 domain-containing protein [Candidatus Dormiibacterota bacterium]
MARLIYAAAGLVLVLVLAGCGGGQAGTSPTPGASSTSSPSPLPSSTASGSSTPVPTLGPTASGGVQRCTVAELTVSVGQSNAGAGTVQRAFVFTNRTQQACALYGYPGMLLLGANGQALPTTVVRLAGSKQAVTLAPGGTASFLARWHDQTGYTTPCPSSTSVEVTPPNAYNHLMLTLSLQACPDGTINVTAVTAGSTGGE